MSTGNCVHEVFAARARENPHRVAVDAPGERVTYDELDGRAERLARRLRARGVGPDTLVALCCERGVALIVGMLGILKAGGAYVPIDAAYPDERIRLLLSTSGVGLVVSAGSSASRLAGTGVDVEVVRLDESSDEVDGAPAPPAEAAGHHLAYVIYTSGSTGTPKGVLVEHSNVVRLFTSTAPWFGFDERDVWTLFHSPSFDFSVWEIFGALLHGGRLVVVPTETTRRPAELLTLLRRERVTVLNQTPSAFRQLVAADAAAAPTDLALRLVILGGERLDVAILRRWLERHGDEQPRLINMYGITETTVHVTYRRIREADLQLPERSPIGVAIPDLRMTLHDEMGRQVPDGTPGEIWVGGQGVARGYLNRPELTAERFITGPDGTRCYRSGDRAVRTAQDDMMYLGRLDDQIKVRGYRIEPHEVEACLCSHPSVLAAAVTSRDYGDGDVRLVAYVQSTPAVAGDAGQRLVEDLTRHAATHLPAHLRPSSYLPVEQIPMTAQGKADRKALRRWLDSSAPARPTEAGDGALAGPTWAVVAGIAADVLERESIAPEEDLFDLGATSLAFIRIVAEVNERFGVSLTGAEVNDASVACLAAAVEAALTGPVAVTVA